MTIQDIFALPIAQEQIAQLSIKSVRVQSWANLKKEYDPKLHPVMTDKSYKDSVKKGKVVKQTRITMSLQKLACKRISGLLFGIPARRVYKPKNDQEQAVADVMEAVYMRNRIDHINRQRCKALYAACEIATIWFTQESDVTYGEFMSPVKLRCRTFSPMYGDKLYPLFDDYDDLIALSVEYQRAEGNNTITYFETYTADRHIRWRYQGSRPVPEVDEQVAIGKIQGVYMHKEEPVWEDQSENVYEAEWTMSRNGNYIRKNARPTWVEYTNNPRKSGGEPADDNAGRNILRYGKDDKAGYATWTQAIDSIKFHLDSIKREFFTELQLPDMSMDNMKDSPMSGESRKMLFLDGQMKADDESGIWLEAFDREVNVVRAFLKEILPDSYKTAIDSLYVENVITAYTIREESERIQNAVNATGGKAIMSQKTAVQYLGYVDDVDEELQQIAQEETGDLTQETMM